MARSPVALDVFTLSAAGAPFDLSFYDGQGGTPHAYVVRPSFVVTRTDGGQRRAQ